MTNSTAVLLFLADTHCGSTTGLLRDNWQLPQGGTYFPSFIQRRIWDQFTEGIERAAQLKKELDARLLTFVVGDPCDGDHHDTSELITRDTGQHVGIHTDAMNWALERLSPQKLFYINPTETHNKPSLADDCAKDLGAVPFHAPTREDKKDGKWTWPEMKFKVNGKSFYVVHQGATVSKAVWLEETGLYNELKRQYWRAAADKKCPPDYYICAHLHKYITVNYKKITGIILPALQAKTEYGHKVSSFQKSDIGMVIVVVRGDGQGWDETVMMQLTECEAEEL